MGSGNSQPVLSSALAHQQFGSYQVGVAGVNGYRDGMEDAEVFFDAPAVPGKSNAWAFFGVFDGHGGDTCSKAVAAQFTEQMTAARTAQRLPWTTDADVEAMCLYVDKTVARHEDGSTGTFCTAEFTPAGTIELVVGNVGDSRVVACIDGIAVGLTEDHKPESDGEKRRIYDCGGTVEGSPPRVNGQLAVSRAFGDRDLKRSGPNERSQPVVAVPDVVRRTLIQGDFIVLCCDGVFENDAFTRDSLIKFVKNKLRKPGNGSSNFLARVARETAMEAIAKGSKDNVTVMIVRFDAPTRIVTPEARAPVTFTKGLAMPRPVHTYIPGAVRDPKNSPYMETYFRFARVAAGLSPAEALARRWDDITNKTFAEFDGPTSDEKAFFGSPPKADVDGARMRYFQDLAGDAGPKSRAPAVRGAMPATPEEVSDAAMKKLSSLKAMMDDWQPQAYETLKPGRATPEAVKAVKDRFKRIGEGLLATSEDLPEGDKRSNGFFKELVGRLEILQELNHKLKPSERWSAAVQRNWPRASANGLARWRGWRRCSTMGKTIRSCRRTAAAASTGRRKPCVTWRCGSPTKCSPPSPARWPTSPPSLTKSTPRSAPAAWTKRRARRS